MAQFDYEQYLFHCVTSHIIYVASVKSDNLGRGIGILIYDEKGA